MKISIINAEICKTCLIQFRNFKAVHPCMGRSLAAPIFKDYKFFVGCRSQDFHAPVIKIPDRPLIPNSIAFLQVALRKPTPWTFPLTTIFR